MFVGSGSRDGTAMALTCAHSAPHLLRLEGDRLVADPHPDIERYHQPAGIDSPSTAAQAVDITWSPTPGDDVKISRGSQPVASARRMQSGILIHIGESATIPLSDLRIIIDGPVLELATAGANFGTAIHTLAGELSITTCGPAPQIRTLIKPARCDSPFPPAAPSRAGLRCV
jgi:beta-fructofuranosidase